MAIVERNLSIRFTIVFTSRYVASPIRHMFKPNTRSSILLHDFGTLSNVFDVRVGVVDAFNQVFGINDKSNVVPKT